MQLVLNELDYEHCGMFDNQPRATPTFLRVREYVQKQRVHGRMSLWKASAQRVLEALCFRHGLGPVLNTAPTVNLAELLAQPVVLKLEEKEGAWEGKTTFLRNWPALQRRSG